eukprot:s701_g6.t1
MRLNLQICRNGAWGPRRHVKSQMEGAKTRRVVQPPRLRHHACVLEISEEIGADEDGIPGPLLGCTGFGEVCGEPGACQKCQKPLEPIEQRLRHRLCNVCCFREQDPFKPVVEVDHVLYMAVLPGRHLAFTLEVPDLRSWRKQGFEVELRGLRRRASSEPQALQQAWPSFLSLEVNGKEVFATKVPLRGHKRRDVPQSLSASLQRGTNSVEVTAEDERRRDYLLAVVRTAVDPCLLIRIWCVSVGRTFPLKPQDLADECLERVQQILVSSRTFSDGSDGLRRPTPSTAPSDGDGVECVGDEHVKLLCPITLTRPTSLPVRGKGCRHLQCLDLEAYLISNYRMKAFNSRWRCPTCSFELRPARCVQAKRADCPTRRPRDLIVDSFVQTLLAQTAEETEEDTRGLILPLQSLSTSWFYLMEAGVWATQCPSVTHRPLRSPLHRLLQDDRQTKPKLQRHAADRSAWNLRSKESTANWLCAPEDKRPVNKPRRAPARGHVRAAGALKRPVVKRTAAARRAAAIAAGPNRYVGVDSDASPEMASSGYFGNHHTPFAFNRNNTSGSCQRSMLSVSASSSIGARKKQRQRAAIGKASQASGHVPPVSEGKKALKRSERVGPSADIEAALTGRGMHCEKLFELASRPAIRVAVGDSFVEVVQDRSTQEHSGGVVWETAFFLLRYLQRAIIPGMRQSEGRPLRVVELGTELDHPKISEDTCAFASSWLFPTLGVGLLDFKVSYYSSPAETTSWSAQPHRLP